MNDFFQQKEFYANLYPLPPPFFFVKDTHKMVVQVDNLWKLDDTARAAFIRTKLRHLKKDAQAQFQVLIQEYDLNPLSKRKKTIKNVEKGGGFF